MQSITYYKASLEDTQTLVDHRILFALELTGEQTPETIQTLKTQMKDYFSKAIPKNECISFIAKCGEEIAGVGSVHFRQQPGNFKNPSGKWGYIMNMYTVPAYRRNGICKAILEELIKEATEYGVTAFELHATKDGEPVYLQNGFKIHSEPTYRKFI